MPLAPVTHQSWIFSPPLEQPLSLRLSNGRFDSLRPRPLPRTPACASTQVIPADDPRNPTGRDVPIANGVHQAVDLGVAAGSCVYAAYGGRVVKTEVQPGGATANLSIDHHPTGLGFVTCYNHIDGLRVDVGERVEEGEPIARVSAADEDPALHFELWAVLDRAAAGRDRPPGDSDMVPVDPTRPLYAWERRLAADESLPAPMVPLAVGVTIIETIPFFVARFEDGTAVHVPLYEPVAADEALVVELLRQAHRRRTAVRLSVRRSSFWGLDVAAAAELEA